MSVRLPQRGVLTDMLLEHLASVMVTEELGITVCDGMKEAGATAGWPGDPGEGDFVPYTVVGTGPANPIVAEPTSLAGQHSTWLAGYTLSHYGSSRQQADWCADKVRAAALSFDDGGGLDLGELWSIESITFPSLGAITVSQAITPPLWSGGDSVMIRINRKRNQGT